MLLPIKISNDEIKIIKKKDKNGVYRIDNEQCNIAICGINKTKAQN